ncbi:MAG: aspartate carbamoyltransferase catalytic subunit [Deltaproteobacteria bacterium]|nr:aspartate carbamoyltransferase catalytic subunit [Deltaproteobacteria bacterium]
MLKHLLGIEGLTLEQLEFLLGNAGQFVEVGTRELKKVPALRGKTIVNLFLEPSTRTRASFEIAGKRLSADTINIGASDSSVVKGETLLDTARNLEAMAPDILVIRHKESGAPHFLARHLTNTCVVNAGDGLHEHPTQALLDILTLRQHFKTKQRDVRGLKIAIVGDVRHSRVARSNIWAHRLLGNQVTLVGPPTLVPAEFADVRSFGGSLKIEHNLARGIEGADVVLCLRMQLERQTEHFVPTLEEYSHEYCVSERMLSRYAPDSVVLHPGPANRGTEISGEVLDGKRSLVTQQVNNGVAVRMAVLFALATGSHSTDIAGGVGGAA